MAAGWPRRGESVCASTPSPSASTRPRTSTSSSRCRSAASPSSTRWTRRPARSSSTASCTRPCAIPATTASCRTPCRRTAIPIDVLVANTRPIVPGAVINVRPIGVLKMEDDAGGDEKILAVPTPKLTKRYEHVAQLHRPAADHARAGAALLRALQGPGARQVGEDAAAGATPRKPSASSAKPSSGRSEAEDVASRRPCPRPDRSSRRRRPRRLRGRACAGRCWPPPRSLGSDGSARARRGRRARNGTGDGAPSRSRRALAAALAPRPVDVNMVPADPASRRKQLLVADMESTIIEQECLDEIADYRRPAARASPTSRRGPCAASSTSRRR